MEQYTDSQYDDDLTVGADEYSDTFQTGDVDLFEFGGDEESPISRLKTLVLSIDWEITDEVLIQFNEEILDLKDIWANDQVRVVYLQALEKISRYIYRDKSDAHPNAIKLLLGMYYNLEKIVLSEDLSDHDRKQILMGDVSRFEKLKQQIAEGEERRREEEAAVGESFADSLSGDSEDQHELTELKAIVLGIDWEISDKDLLELREEVLRLEAEYAGSKPKLVFLQAIGTLGAYIRKKKSNAHADAFALMHSFYDGLEKIVLAPMSFEEEKAVLYPEVQKFNAFKRVIAETIEPGQVAETADEGAAAGVTGVIAPAFADIPEDEVQGFREEDEAAALSGESPVAVDEHIDKFFGEESGQPVPPLAAPKEQARSEAEELSDSFFSTDGDESVDVDRETALQGVDVETEADDESDEEALPELGGEIAPALLGSDEMSEFSEASAGFAGEEELADEISGKLDAFFPGLEEEEQPAKEEPEEESPFAVPASVALQGVDVGAEGDEEDEDVEAPLASVAGMEPEEPAAALSVEEDEIASAFADIDQEDIDVDDFEPMAAALQGVADEGEPAAPAETAADVEDEEAVAKRFDALFGIDTDEAAGEVQEVERGEAPAAMADEVPEPVAALSDVGAGISYGALRDCVQALDREPADSTISALIDEVALAREVAVADQVSLNYLQLFETVARHIDRYRSESSEDAPVLLAELLSAMEQSSTSTAEVANTNLLRDTARILNWQQELLDRQAVEKEGRLVFRRPLRETAADSGVSFEESSEKTDEVKAAATGLGEQEDVTKIVRKELDDLRETLSREIAELRNAIKGEDRDE